MEGPDEKSSLENVRERLYAPKKMDIVRPSSVHHTEVAVPTEWEPEPVPIVAPPAPKMSWAVKFLLSAVGFFIIAGAISAILLFGGLRAISTERVSIEITSSKSNLASGDTVEFFVTVINKNPTAITNTNLVVDLPPGTRNPTNLGEPFDNYIDTALGDIPSGGQVTKSFKAVLFGAQNQVLAIPSRLEYRTAGSNALAVKKSDYSVTVTTSPILVTVAPVGEVASGQLFTLNVTVRSNATTPLSALALTSQYPSGFVETTTNPSTKGGFFSLGTLSPGEERVLSITGTLTGQSADERAFTFTAGTAKEDGSNALSLPYASAVADVTIAKPFLGVALTFNHDATEPATVPAALPVNALLTWQNTLSVPVQNAQITVTLTGAPLDASSVTTQNGFYRSSDSTLIFTSDTNPSLALLQPGDSGSASFSFSPKSTSVLSGLRNPTINLLLSVSGRRAGDNGGVGVVTSTVTRKILVASSISLASSLSRTDGTFANTGPLPPKANAETTYTVLMSAKNSLNSIGGAKVTATLPDYVGFTGKTSTKSGTITFDASSKVVTWNIGDISSNASVDGAFQVALVPSSSQAGTNPRILGTQSLTGSDTFTKKTVSISSDALTTASVGGITEDGIVTR